MIFHHCNVHEIEQYEYTLHVQSYMQCILVCYVQYKYTQFIKLNFMDIKFYSD